MDITTSDKLLLVVLFVIPGFVAMKTYAIVSSGPRLDASKAVIDAIAFSCCIYALFALPIYGMHYAAWATRRPVAYAAVWGFILLFAPVLCAVAFFALRRSKLLARWLPHPVDRAWDYIFAKREASYLIITLTSGKRIGAKYDTNSFASSHPAEPEIYVEETWDVDDAEGFVRRHVQTRGLLVAGSAIESIEFIGPYDGNEQRNDETDDDTGDCEGRIPTNEQGLPARCQAEPGSGLSAANREPPAAATAQEQDVSSGTPEGNREGLAASSNETPVSLDASENIPSRTRVPSACERRLP